MSVRSVYLDPYEETEERITFAAGGALARELIPNGLVWRTPGLEPPCYLCAHPFTPSEPCRHCKCIDHIALNSGGDDAHEFARRRYRELRRERDHERYVRNRAARKG